MTLTNSTIHLHNVHGFYSVTPAQLDDAIDKYLPESRVHLRAILTDRTGLDYSDVESHTELLIILADMDGGR